MHSRRGQHDPVGVWLRPPRAPRTPWPARRGAAPPRSAPACAGPRPRPRRPRPSGPRRARRGRRSSRRGTGRRARPGAGRTAAPRTGGCAAPSTAAGHWSELLLAAGLDLLGLLALQPLDLGADDLALAGQRSGAGSCSAKAITTAARGSRPKSSRSGRDQIAQVSRLVPRKPMNASAAIVAPLLLGPPLDVAGATLTPAAPRRQQRPVRHQVGHQRPAAGRACAPGGSAAVRSSYSSRSSRPSANASVSTPWTTLRSASEARSGATAGSRGSCWKDAHRSPERAATSATIGPAADALCLAG